MTPLRYPGGKQRLAPFIEEILEANDAVGWNYVEPYAGGAGIAVELLLKNRVSRIYLNDSSYQVYALWRTIVNAPDELCRRISSASLSVREWERQREINRRPAAHDLVDVGFSTFYLNRCNRSGVLTAGMIGGYAQKGRWRIDARFPRNELISRIEAISKVAQRITVTNLDAEAFLLSRVNRLQTDTLVYCDPPYYARSKRLYLNTYANDDHARVACIVQERLRHPWVVSYDNHPAITRLYKDRRRFYYSLQYSAIRAYSGREVFIFADSLTLPSESRVLPVSEALRSLNERHRKNVGAG